MHTNARTSLTRECHKQFDESADCFFASNYFEARQQFLREAKAAGLEHTALHLRDELFIDVAVRRGREDAVLLHISGTHGTEGFVGSAVQRAVLRHRNETLVVASSSSSSSSLQRAPTVIFVHALNPFGMAFWRRFNEDNVDLNRNAVFVDSVWDMLMKREPNFAGYGVCFVCVFFVFCFFFLKRFVQLRRSQRDSESRITAVVYFLCTSRVGHHVNNVSFCSLCSDYFLLCVWRV